jgi:hypothetical protein
MSLIPLAVQGFESVDGSPLLLFKCTSLFLPRERVVLAGLPYKDNHRAIRKMSTFYLVHCKVCHPVHNLCSGRVGETRRRTELFLHGMKNKLRAISGQRIDEKFL